MTEFEPAPVPYASPPPLPAHLSRGPTVLAWVVIVACVALIVFAGLRPREPEPLAVESDRPGGSPSTEFVMQARLAVGVRHLFGGGAGGPAARQFAAALNQAASSPADRLRAAIVAEAVNGDSDDPAGVSTRLKQIAAEDLPAVTRRDLATLQNLYQLGSRAIDADRRRELLARHGWFAELALTHDLPEYRPERRAALAPALRAARAGLIAVALGGLAFAVGLVLLVLALVRYLEGRVRFAYFPPLAGRGGPFVEAFAIYLLGMIAVSTVLGLWWRGSHPPLWANFLLASSVPPALLWPRLRGLSWAEVRSGLGLHRGRGALREALAGVAGYVAGLPLLAVAVVATSVLMRLSGTTPTHPITEEASAGINLPRALQLYALAAVYAPVAEELMFRGAFYHHVRGRLPWFVSAVLVAVVFAAIHPQGWVGIPMLATIAVVLATLREWRGSIIAPMVAHACVNGVTVTMLVMLAG
jgi:membrane protease YdiL (CAAX protease family)